MPSRLRFEVAEMWEAKKEWFPEERYQFELTLTCDGDCHAEFVYDESILDDDSFFLS